MDLFREFIDTTFDGNQALAARALGVSKSLVSRMASGERTISPELALCVEQLSGGRFKKEHFIWPENATGAGSVADAA